MTIAMLLTNTVAAAARDAAGGRMSDAASSAR